MPLSPQQRRRAPLPSFLRRQEPSLANADQTLTEVDARLTEVNARLTGVDKGCQKLAAVNPSAIPTLLSNTPRTNLNNPEQIRTNPNTAERPDQIGTPLDHPRPPEKKQNPNTFAAIRHRRHTSPPSVIPAPHSSFLRLSSVIPAQAGTHPHLTFSLPQFIPPPFQGGG